MEPQTYNAYYNPSNNEIVVPGCNIIPDQRFFPGYALAWMINERPESLKVKIW